MACEAELRALTKIGQDFLEIATSLLQHVTDLENRVDLLEDDPDLQSALRKFQAGATLDEPLETDTVLHEAAAQVREELLRDKFRG